MSFKTKYNRIANLYDKLCIENQKNLTTIGKQEKQLNKLKHQNQLLTDECKELKSITEAITNTSMLEICKKLKQENLNQKTEIDNLKKEPRLRTDKFFKHNHLDIHIPNPFHFFNPIPTNLEILNDLKENNKELKKIQENLNSELTDQHETIDELLTDINRLEHEKEALLSSLINFNKQIKQS